jgi:hypothetical protein
VRHFHVSKFDSDVVGFTQARTRRVDGNGDFIYEPFAGSGSTLIAAETVGRVCLAMEIDPRYCDVIVERWQRFAGGEPVLASVASRRSRRSAAEC